MRYLVVDGILFGPGVRDAHDFYPGTVVHQLPIDVRSKWSWSYFAFQKVNAIYLTTVGKDIGAGSGWNHFLGKNLFSYTHQWAQYEMQRRARKSPQ